MDPTATATTSTAVTAGSLLARFGRATAEHDWVALRGVLADDAEVHYAHTGERLDPDRFVALVRDYPGEWTFHADEVVDAGDRAVLHSRTVIGAETWHCATFASLDPRAPDRLTDLIEVWTESVTPHRDRSKP